VATTIPDHQGRPMNLLPHGEIVAEMMT
jgi:hypothetical protein